MSQWLKLQFSNFTSLDTFSEPRHLSPKSKSVKTQFNISVFPTFKTSMALDDAKLAGGLFTRHGRCIACAIFIPPRAIYSSAVAIPRA
jgi:hypothetical protein